MEPIDSATESALLKRVDHGLEIAVRESGLKWQDERNRTKREKYQFFAIRDNSDELPVTYSWYRYGISAIVSNIDRSLPITGSDSRILHMDEGEIAEYYLSELEVMELSDWWPNDITVLEFLTEFYDLECPTNLKEIYLANVELRRILEQRILHRISNDVGTIPDDDYYDLQEQLLRVKTELASDQGEPVFDDAIQLTDLYDDFLEYSDMLEDAILATSKRRELAPNGAEYKTITKLKNVFDGTVWPYLTCVISARTGEGPNASMVEELAEGKFKQVSADWSQELKATENQRRRANLYADIDDYRSNGEEISTKVDELMEVIDGDADPDR